ncbi:alpha/beta hydrolase [Massilia niastensis]|uniref:alpha/beta hydrolase n=1 Tax=Massilia niastensis TaxID=544911 RepID=UPI000363FCAB|nr:alpha/beta hydrolase [Massilia niastensis]
MKPARSFLLCLAALSAAGSTLAQAPAPAASRHKLFPTAPAPAYVSPDTPQGSGRFPAVMEAESSLATHTIYRPADLAALGKEKLPVVAFANGGCVNVGNRFRYFLSEIASHGFLAIATGPMAPKEVESALTSSVHRVAPAPGSPADLVKGQPQGEGNARPSQTTAKQLLDAVNWAIAENTRKGGKYEGRIDTGKVAVMGQSCGGLQAIDAGHDPRVTTVGVWNSGTFPEQGRSWTMAAAQADKADLKTLRVPVLYVSGEPADVAYPNAEDDFERIEAPVFRAWREQTGHLGTYQEPNGGAYGQVAAAWLQWQLKGDQKAARQFVGADCGLCTKPEWHVKSRGLGAAGTAKLVAK